jgi:hypothetical protein|nr:MAG TPA: hypothetical protein [Caudoviricetes sp.]
MNENGTTEIPGMHLTATIAPDEMPGKYALTLIHFGGALADLSARYVLDYAAAISIVDQLKGTQEAGSRRTYDRFELVRIGDRAFMMMIPTAEESRPLPIELLRTLPIVDRATWCPFGLSQTSFPHDFYDKGKGMQIVFVQVY